MVSVQCVRFPLQWGNQTVPRDALACTNPTMLTQPHAGTVVSQKTETTIVLSIAAKLRRVGRGKRLVIGEPTRAEINPNLVRLMQEAIAARTLLLADTTESINVITGKAALADARVFLILNRIEITEVLATTGAKTKPGQTVFLQPEVCEGLTALEARLHDLMPLRRRTVILLEMAAIAQAVTHYLVEAPAVARGRPRREA